MGFFSDLFSGNFSALPADVTADVKKLPQSEQDFIVKLESDSWTFLRSEAAVAFEDVIAGGFTSAGFAKAAKDIVANGLAQGQTILISDAYIQLNILKSAYVAPVVAPVVEAPVAGPVA